MSNKKQQRILSFISTRQILFSAGVAIASVLINAPASYCDDWRNVLSQAQSDLSSGNLDQADAEFRQAEKLIEAEKIGGNDDAAKKATLKKNGLCLVDCLVGISRVNDRKGNYADSDQVYETALDTLQKMCDGGWKSHQYADYLPGIAELYDRHGKSDQAELAWKKIIDIRTVVDPKEDPNRMLAAYEGYSKYLRSHQRPDEAVILENKASQIRYSQQ